MIPEHLLEQVAQANDIVEVISGYFPLKRAGSAYKARCPFHQEKTASFSVNPARQIFKCFGCGAGGGVFKFVELYENVPFPEAVKRLAARVGIRVEEEPLTAEEDAQQKMKRRLLALHAAAAEWFHEKLLRTKAGQGARDYLKSRGITTEVAKNWKLGYAPNTWDALTHWAAEQGFRDDELIASGLVTWKETEDGSSPSHFYDRFRDRLMFPIYDDLAQVIAFSGRVLNAEAFGGKYVNSPETPLFTKGKVLFGLQKTKRAILNQKAVIVCEGQLDLITVYEAGVQNVTASQGTAFTFQQASLLKQRCGADEVILCFDADAAGLKAAERSLPALLAADLTVRVAEMPAGHDPDSLIRAEGVEAFTHRIAQARDFFDCLIERAAAMPDFATPKGKAAFARKMAGNVALVADPVLRDAVIHNVSRRLELAPAQFTQLVAEASKSNDRRPMGREEAQEEVSDEPNHLPPMSNTTRLLCQLALLNAEVREWLFSRPWEALFESLPDGELLLTVMRAPFDPANPASVTAFLAGCRDAEQSVLAELLEKQDDKDRRKNAADPLRLAADCWRDLERRDLERQLNAAASRLRLPGAEADEILRLQGLVQQLQQQINALRA